MHIIIILFLTMVMTIFSIITTRRLITSLGVGPNLLLLCVNEMLLLLYGQVSIIKILLIVNRC